jgi:hypothetical protein
MKIRNVILALGMVVLGASAFAAGCGSNPCQDYNDALDKASMGKGCSSLKMSELPAATVSNCPSTVDSNAVDCISSCIGKLKDCTNTQQFLAYASCAGKCQGGGG